MGQPKRKEKNLEAVSSSEQTPKIEKTEGSTFEQWVKPAGLSRRGWTIIAAITLLINLPVIHYFLLRPRPDATISIPYRDDFSNPSTVQNNYWTTGGFWRVVNGELLAPGVKNNPLWLKAKLPANVAVEFDARSQSREGDIKVEIFGDGSDHASGYVLIHGGWNNSVSIIARLDEHGVALNKLRQDARRISGTDDPVKAELFEKGTHMRIEAAPYPVQIGRTYHWRIERRGSLLRWFIDGQPFMEFDDPFPLTGPDHDRFGFSSWEAQLYFDNLKIEAL